MFYNSLQYKKYISFLNITHFHLHYGTNTSFIIEKKNNNNLD